MKTENELFTEVNEYISVYGTKRTLISISALLGIRENFKLLPILEKWIVFISDQDYKKGRIIKWPSSKSLVSLVSKLNTLYDEEIRRHEDFFASDFPFDMKKTSVVGRKGKLYEIFPDIADSLFFHLPEALQFIEQISKKIYHQDEWSNLSNLLDFFFKINDYMRKELRKLNEKGNYNQRKVGSVMIPTNAYIKQWLKIITIDSSKMADFEIPPDLALSKKKFDENSNQIEIPSFFLVDEAKFYFFAPFFALRYLYNYYAFQLHEFCLSKPGTKEIVIDMLRSYLISILNSFNAESPIIPFVKLFDKDLNQSCSADIGALLDATKIILIHLEEPIEDNTNVYSEKMYYERKQEINLFTKRNLILSSGSKDVSFNELNFENAGNIEIYHIFISGILVPHATSFKFLKEHKMVFSTLELRNILINTDSVSFPIYLRLRNKIQFDSPCLINFVQELDFFEFIKNFGFQIPFDDSKAIISIQFNWDISEWDRRNEKSLIYNPNYTDPTIPFITKVEKVERNSYQVYSSGVWLNSWKIPFKSFLFTLFAHPSRYLPWGYYFCSMIIYYFDKYNELIEKFIKEERKEGKKPKNLFLTIYINDESQDDHLVSIKDVDVTNDHIAFDFRINMKKEIIDEFLTEKNGILEYYCVEKILHLIINEENHDNSISEKYRLFLERITNKTMKFKLFQRETIGKPSTLQTMSLKIPEWIKIQIHKKIISFKINMAEEGKILEKKPLAKYYRDIAKYLQSSIEDIVFKVSKDAWLIGLNIQLNNVLENREFDTFRFGTAYEWNIMDSKLEDLIEHFQELGNLSMSLRHVIETTLSDQNDPKNNTYLPNNEIYFHTVYLSELMRIHSVKSDEVYYGLLDEKIQLKEDGSYAILSHNPRINLQSFQKRKFQSIFSLIAEEALSINTQGKQEIYEEKETTVDYKKLFRKMDRSFEDEFGISIRKILAIYESILSYLDENNSVYIANPDQLKFIVHYNLPNGIIVEEKEYISFLENFTIKTINHDEIQSWKVRLQKNRIAFKPIINLDGSNFLLALRLIETAQEMIKRMLFEGIFPYSTNLIQTESLKTTYLELRQCITNEFEKNARKIMTKYIKIIEENSLKNPYVKWNIRDPQKMEIDGFGIIPHKRTILIIECKDQLYRYDLKEISNEFNKFEEKGGYLDKHKRRCNFVQKYIQSILDYYEIGDKENYSVLGVFVLKNVKNISFLKKVPFKFFDLDSFEIWLDDFTKV